MRVIEGRRDMSGRSVVKIEELLRQPIRAELRADGGTLHQIHPRFTNRTPTMELRYCIAAT